MKSFIKLAFTTLLIITAAHAFAADDRHLSGFNAVNVAGSYDVYITQGSTESVKVDAPSDMLDKITTEVNNGVLKITNKDNINWRLFTPHPKVTIYITIKDVTAITLSGSGNISFKDGVTSNTLQLKVSGSGNLSGTVTAKALEGVVTGSGNIKINGKADNSKVSVTGSGNFNGRDFATINTAARVTGSGNANISVTESIEANVTGSGSILYKGTPKNIIKTKTGSGSIRNS